MLAQLIGGVSDDSFSVETGVKVDGDDQQTFYSVRQLVCRS